MTKELVLAGDVGWEINPEAVREELASAAGESLDIKIVSPGGSVYDGIEIYNILRDYTASFPTSKITITMQGQVMSMMAYISTLPAAHVKAYDNAVYMIHNPWTMAIGDYAELRKTADVLEGLANLSAEAHARKSGKSIQEIKTLLEAETYYFGKEIVEAGFADELIESKEDLNRDSAVATTKVLHTASINAIKKKDSNLDFKALEKLVSRLDKYNKPKQQETEMDLTEFKQKHPELYKIAVTEGKALGEKQAKDGDASQKAIKEAVQAEKDRVSGLMALQADKKYQDIEEVSELIASAIKKGKAESDIRSEIADIVLAKFEDMKLGAPLGLQKAIINDDSGAYEA